MKFMAYHWNPNEIYGVLATLKLPCNVLSVYDYLSSSNLNKRVFFFKRVFFLRARTFARKT